MPFTAKHANLMKRLLDKGIVLLQAERMTLGIDLKGLGFVNGRQAKLLGKPCYVLYGFTDAGFDHMLSHYPALITEPGTYETPPPSIRNKHGGNDNDGCHA